ncbi:RHS repeat domain-containing protein [uncultured Muribaculum sp.]|uniref:RHS repeat domain-containing protein n=1 Tax=uncultured Muribaculum sp. TaxID=1918613 RepID=UPI0025F0BA3A|nr:RHS repeat-associated core domain-containing protein [uncultured Muribaculum sp.]
MNDLRFGTSGLMWIDTYSTPKERHRDVYDDGLWRGYTYTYDGADRLVSAVYGETGSRPATLIAESPDYSEYRSYDAGSNLAALKACGLIDRQRVSNLETKLSFGPVKDIVFENRGAQMLSATVAPNSATVSTMDNSVIGALKEGKTVGFNYDAAGRLVEDGLRGESFTYDRFGNPSVARYSTGDDDDYLAKYAYDATGVLHKRSMAYNYELIYKRDEPLVPIYPDSLRPGYHYPWDSLPPRLDSIITPRPVFPSPVGAQPALSGSSSPQAISVLWPPGNRRDSLGRVDDILARTPHMDYAYCGNYEYRNGSLSRIVTPVGYYEGGRHHYQLNDYQGNVRCVVSDTLRLVSAVHYYPGGSLFGESHGYWQDGRLFQGAQLEKSYGHAFYDLLNRHYDPVLCRFTSIDALSENARGVSGYIYCLGNPVKYRDSNGLNPIYSLDGDFLGTDDYGLQGIPYIMDRENFEQGMSFRDVMKYSVSDGIPDDIFGKVTAHYSLLPQRPDYDGFVTITEGIAWAKANPDALLHPTPDNSLYIKASELDFGDVSSSELRLGKKESIDLFSINNAWASIMNARLRASVYALGNGSVILLDKATRSVRIVNDNATDYDWNEGGSFKRNTAIKINNWLFDLDAQSDGFKVYYHGIGRLNQ